MDVNLNDVALFVANSTGDQNDKTRRAITDVGQIFPNLTNLIQNKLNVQNIEDIYDDSSISLRRLLIQHNSDKSSPHRYHILYNVILKDRENIKNVLEVGLGTNNPGIISTMGVGGSPGASLRAFKEYLPNANIYGLDIDKDILFEEERIKTYFVDQTDARTFNQLDLPNDFDLIIDDGLHSPNANLTTLLYGLTKVKIGGYVVIEDIAREALPFWVVVSALLPDTYEQRIYDDGLGLIYSVKNMK